MSIPLASRLFRWEKKGTSGAERKGKFVELSLLSVSGQAGTWTIAASKEGKVFGGTNGNIVFGLKGMDLSAVFKKKAAETAPR